MSGLLHGSFGISPGPARECAPATAGQKNRRARALGACPAFSVGYLPLRFQKSLHLGDRLRHIDAVLLEELAQGPPGRGSSSHAHDAALHEKPDRGGVLLDEILDRYIGRQGDLLHDVFLHG
jgi:hypothetical protein